MRGDEGTGAHHPDDFADALADVKADGCSLLVVGRVPEEASTKACRRMLGDANVAHRERLLVFADATREAAADRLPRHEGCTASATVIDYGATARSTAAAAPVDDAGPGGAGRVDDDVTVRCVRGEDLGDLGTTISRAIDGLVPADPEDGALRVCFDSLSPLLETHDDATVFQFLHALSNRVHAVNGLAHFHLPVNADAYETRLLAPLFDAVVELRMAEGRLEQRWRLRDADVSTEWLAV
jgi:hypothetical protein